MDTSARAGRSGRRAGTAGEADARSDRRFDLSTLRRSRWPVDGAWEGWRLTVSPYPMWVFARESGAVIAANDAAVTAYGGTRGELLEATAFEIFPHADGPRAVNILDDRHEDILWIGPWMQRRKDGRTSRAEVGVIETRGPTLAMTRVFLNQRLDEAGSVDAPAGLVDVG